MRRPPDNPRLLLHELMRRDFGSFLRKAYSTVKGGETLMWNWHLGAIAHSLEQIANGVSRRSLINLPPRNLKSMMVSVAWVAWMLGRDPTQNFVCVSYSNELSAKFGRDCIAIMRSGWYRQLFPGTIISARRSAAYDFETTRGGGRLATSIAGTLTGRGGDIIIVDDPIKPDESMSETAREAVNEWYKLTLSSRLNDKSTGAIIVVMQRLHEHDLAGMLLQAGWDRLNLSAIATEDEIVPLAGRRFHHRSRGDLLHPAREPIEVLDELRAAMGSAAFSAQYQQNPLPALGNVILSGWLKTYSSDFDRTTAPGYIAQSWDTATKDGAHNDFSVCVTAHVHRREIRILHVYRERLQFPDLKRQAIRLAREWKATTILIEDQASGSQLLQTLKSEQPRGVAPPIAENPQGDKISRLLGASSDIEAGKLMLPVDAPWLAEFKAELLGAPNTRFDDQCDALSQLMNWVQLREGRVEAPPLAGGIVMTYDNGCIEIAGDGYSDDFETLGVSAAEEIQRLLDDPWLGYICCTS